MKIQHISLREMNEYEHTDIHLATFSKPNHPDDFDINIIDLRDDDIWCNTEDNVLTINDIKDLNHIRNMITDIQKSKILVIHPLNFRYHYDYGYDNDTKRKIYRKKKEIKNILRLVGNTIFESILGFKYEIVEMFVITKFADTKTKIYDEVVDTSFYFDVEKDDDIKMLTKSYPSEKATTIEFQGRVITTLNLEKTPQAIFDFLKHIGLYETRQVSPEWFESIDKFDDKRLKEQNIINEKKVKSLKDTIQNNNEKIQENNFYKSILYTNGHELIEATYNILEELLNCSLSEFVDEYKEDFSIEKEKNVFVGEIKGVTSNVKNRHVSQIDNHVQDYNDKPEEGKNSKIPKGVLIINYQREREPSKRDNIGESQISIAKRDGSLIITTPDLLDLYEDYRIGKITSEKIIKEFSSQTGLFKRS